MSIVAIDRLDRLLPFLAMKYLSDVKKMDLKKADEGYKNDAPVS